jgi:thiamine biosynthesis protein ThiS
MNEQITVTINGEQKTINQNITISDLLASYDVEPKMVVVELNAEIISRDQFSNTVIAQNSNIEIVQMMAGG